ncbi:MAG: NAD(P)H-hydrate dehydratase [Acidobacteriota bacterium]|nr:NAD(P)H-hydrate dehydratase [Acidobacteriota bacterium]
MKILTAAQMQNVDRRTSELGIPGVVLMENAGLRVVEFLAERFAPLSSERIVVFCGKGNNGGDGMAIARQLYTRFRPRALHVILTGNPGDLKGDAALNYRMLNACGCPIQLAVEAPMHAASIVIDALLGTGIKGPAVGAILDSIRTINAGFLIAKVVAVDIPSGLPSDSAAIVGEHVRASYTVTFTAPKVSQALPPTCDFMGELIVGPIGSPPELYQTDDSIFLSLVDSNTFRELLAPRPPDSNKGTFGHALIWAGSRGKTGAAAMAGIAALRAGAGLVTVASEQSAIDAIAAHSPEVMTEPLVPGMPPDLHKKTVFAMGPGLGESSETVCFVRKLFAEAGLPVVADADALNALAGAEWRGGAQLRVLTPHPGEMSRLCGKSIAEIQGDRVNVARGFAQERNVHLVLKGQRTLIAFPDGRVWINPTGSPSMATGGTGDILTGMITGFLAQFPKQPDLAIAAAVYLHGLSGQLAAAELGEKCMVATDLLKYLPAAMHVCANP